MSLKEMWAKVDELAEKARAAMPVWCVWEAGNADAGYTLYRAPTREDALQKWKDEYGHYFEAPDMSDMACHKATESQISEHRKMTAGWGRPHGPVSPRAKLEEV